MLREMSEYQLKSCKALEDPSFAPIKINAYSREGSFPKLVMGDVPNPIYSLFVLVPTQVKDHRGLPHTLEHLIFTGSMLFPERGYLDKLATVCLSNGTNAYTTDDHTCYTVTTASLDGLVELLPVYLDHILRPSLKPEDMALEVFSLTPSLDEARGVVYCEMKSREYSEADQMDLRLRSLAFERALEEDPELNTYRWECGGATQRISHLSAKEILAYHQKWYQPEKLTIFVSGILPEAHQAQIKASVNAYFNDYKPCEWEAASELIEVPLKEPVLEREALFPADDESIGSVGFSWLGPNHADLKTILGLHVLLRALKETTASPLYQELVECLDPSATDIDYDVKFLKRTLITLIFSGVPTGKVNEDAEDADEELGGGEEDNSDSENESEAGHDAEKTSKLVPGLIKERMFAVFERLLEDETAFAKFIQTALVSFTIRLQEQVEEDPHELAFGYCIPEILNGPVEAFGSALSEIPAALRALKGEPLEYWKVLLRQFLTRDGCTEVIMRPSSTFPEVIKAREVSNLELVKQLDAFPKSGTALLESFQSDQIPSIKLPSAFGGGAVDRIVLGVSTPAIQLVSLSGGANAGFSTITLGICVRDALDADLWPYLVLFQELIFQSTLSVPSASPSVGLLEAGRRYSYQEVQQLLSLLFTSFEAAVGLGNELFSASYLDSHLILSATFPKTNERGVNVLSALRLLLQALAHSVFEADRIRVTVDNLVNQLAEAKRDPATILDAVFTEQARRCCVQKVVEEDESRATKRGRMESGWLSEAINVFTQETFLTRLQSQLETEPEVILSKLNSIVNGIFGHFEGSFVHVGGAEGINPAHIHGIWQEFFKSPHKLNLGQTPSFKVSEQLPRIGSRISQVLPNEAIRIVPMADVTASYLACSVPVPVLASSVGAFGSHSPESLHQMLSLVLACSILSFTEGPLYNRIRGKGLAYGANLSLSLWNGLLSLDINDSTAPFEAFQTFLQLINDVEAECDAILSQQQDGQMLCKTTLEAAKATFVYRCVSERSTPANIYAVALRSALRSGYPLLSADGDALLSSLIARIELVDIAKALKPYLGAFHQPSQRIITCVVPPSAFPQLSRDFGYQQPPQQ